MILAGDEDHGVINYGIHEPAGNACGVICTGAVNFTSSAFITLAMSCQVFSCSARSKVGSSLMLYLNEYSSSNDHFLALNLAGVAVVIQRVGDFLDKPAHGVDLRFEALHSERLFGEQFGVADGKI